MPAAKGFFDEKREWSSRKHRILGEYLRAFLTALSGNAQKGSNNYLYYVDCFAGAGTYQLDDGTIEMGSPVLAAQIVRKLPYQIKCINVEPEYYASLEENTKGYKDIITNFQGSIEQHIEAILRQVQNTPSLFFLDPFGIKDIPISGLVDLIAQRQSPTDALIRYDPIIVKRLCLRAQKDSQRGPADVLNLDRIFAGHGWRNILAQTSKPEELDAPLLELYKYQLTHIPHGVFNFAGSYPIRTIDDKLKYYLIFVTGRKLGMKIMSSVIYSAEEQFIDDKEAEQIRRFGPPKVWQPDLFGTAQPQMTDAEKYAHKINQITETILHVGRNKASWTFGNLYYRLILSEGWFGKMSDKLFRDTCKQLEQTGNLIKHDPGAWTAEVHLTIIP
jgi:three-Cys-motif partner protein